MIPLTPDPADFPPNLPPEHCCFCAGKTKLWYAPKDVAVCQICAEIRSPSEVPTKEEWCNSPQGRGITEAMIFGTFEFKAGTTIVWKDAKGLFHIDEGPDRDTHGPMTADRVIRWMATHITNLHGLVHKVLP